MTFDDIDDTDPVESSIWYDNIHPQLPRMLLRERFDRGGELAILRDISSSMAGVYSKWASSVILRLVELAKKKRMRVGYIEFNHLSTKYQVEGKFFVRDYEKMARRALNLHCSGWPNYQNSLEDALAGISTPRARQSARPLSDRWCADPGRLGGQSGARVSAGTRRGHPYYLYRENKRPRILEIISEETQGACFRQRQTATGSSASKSGINRTRASGAGEAGWR